MRLIIPLIFILSLACVSALAGERYAGKVDWHSLQNGMEKAGAEKKPVLVDFGIVKGCPRCEFLLKNVYNNDKIVKKINSDFVPVFIDLGRKLTDEEKELGEKYDYKNDCLLLFLDSDGNVIKDPEDKKMCFADKVEPEAFIRYLEQVKNRFLREPH